LGKPRPFDDIAQLRRKLNEASPSFMRLGQVGGNALGPAPAAGAMASAPFASPIADYYMTDPISRASLTMAECSRLYVKGADNQATGTHA
jgi:NADH-quinone oxidoreductase subunit G